MVLKISFKKETASCEEGWKVGKEGGKKVRENERQRERGREGGGRKGRFFLRYPPNCSRAKTYLYALL